MREGSRKSYSPALNSPLGVPLDGLGQLLENRTEGDRKLKIAEENGRGESARGWAGIILELSIRQVNTWNQL